MIEEMGKKGGNLPAETEASTAGPVDDRELAGRLRAGDEAAAREFYRMYAARIHRFIVTALGPHAAEADDLAQETFLSLAEALPFFRGESSLFTFACGIAHRKVASFLRRGARRAGIARPPELASAAAPGEHADVRRALARLKGEHREVLCLKYVEEEPVAAIAAALGLSEHAVESRLARARRALERELGRNP